VLEARREEDRLERERREAEENEKFREEMAAYEYETRQRLEGERLLLEKLKKSTGVVRDWKDIKAEDDKRRQTRAERRRQRQEKWVAEQEAERRRQKEEDKIPGFKAPDGEKVSRVSAVLCWPSDV
jgi:DNA helicase IV